MYPDSVYSPHRPIVLNASELRALRWAAEGLLRVARGDIPASLRSAARRLPAAIAAAEAAETAAVTSDAGSGLGGTLRNLVADNNTPLTAQQAAEILGVTDRRVTQIADQLGGRKHAGRWWFDPDAVAEHAKGAERGRRSRRD